MGDQFQVADSGNVTSHIESCYDVGGTVVENCTDTDKEIGDMDLDQAVAVAVAVVEVVVDAHNLVEEGEEDHQGKYMACYHYSGYFPWIKHSIMLNYPENINNAHGYMK